MGPALPLHIIFCPNRIVIVTIGYYYQMKTRGFFFLKSVIIEYLVNFSPKLAKLVKLTQEKKIPKNSQKLQNLSEKNHCLLCA